jgi:hypothetical protein
VLGQPISRRRVLQLAATAAATLPLLTDATPAGAADAGQANAGQDNFAQATIEAWGDTIVPGQKRHATDRVVAGACPGPGAVQAGVWDLANDEAVGLQPVLPALVALLNAAAVEYAATHRVLLDVTVPPFVALPFNNRTGLALQLLDTSGDEQLVWYALAAIAMLAFHTAAHLDTATAVRDGHPGLSWIEFPEPDPDGLWRFPDFSYQQVLATGHPGTTSAGNPS